MQDEGLAQSRVRFACLIRASGTALSQGRNATLSFKLLYTSSMDRVRLGRALGFGARQAVKTLVTAVDAATAESPSARNTGAKAGQGAPTVAAVNSPAGNTRPARAADSGRGAVQTAAKTVVQAREVQKGLKRGSTQFGQAVWRPFVRLSGVLWLEVTGVFFGLFALMAVGYLWKLRGAWRAGDPASHRSLMGAVVMLVLFGYFCVSSFVRARRRERRR
jgi:hypothetical protein